MKTRTALCFFTWTLFQVNELDAVPVAASNASSHADAPSARFLTPVALEAIGRLFHLQGQITSCHSCSFDYPQHSSACCARGFSSCCVPFVSHPHLNTGYGIGIPSGYNDDYLVKDGACPLVAPNSQLFLYESCFNQCNNDGHCIGDAKCCLYGCTRMCAQPQFNLLKGSSVGSDKSGHCPPNSAMIFPSDSIAVSASSYNYNMYTPWNYANSEHSAVQHCSSDSDCPSHYKCCLRKYQRACMAPSHSYGGYSFGRK